jgi:hypothetical protein
MNTKLFKGLINCVSTKDQLSYFKVWGKRLGGRFVGLSKTYSNISSDESVNTKAGYETFKLRVGETDNIDDLLLMCDCGIKKYDETSSFFKWVRIIAIISGLIFINLFTALGVAEVSRFKTVAKKEIVACSTAKDQESCKKESQKNESDNIQLATDSAKWKAICFSISLSIIGLFLILVISNDNKGRGSLEVLSLYLNRLKLERETV